jgi:regulator of protease activity HflC (stomatin/prohibitin superfamily)
MEDDHRQQEPLLPVSPAGPQMPPEPMDAAGKSLADALSASFRLLSVLMVVVLLVLLATGVRTVQTGSVGVRLLWGRIQGADEGRVLGPGLHWSLPEPVGQVVTVSTAEQKLEINDFWFHELPQDADKPLRDRQVGPEMGLQPGLDGALLTGDRGLVHVKLMVLYAIKSREGKVDAQSVIDYLANPSDPPEAVRSAVCNAAIQAAGARTIDSIYPAGQKDFADAVAGLAQHRLDQLRSGMQINSVLVPVSTVPLAAIAAFDAVTSARQEEERLRNQALGEADGMLRSAAGSSWADLVGDPRTPGKAGLLDLYAQARERNDQGEAARQLEKIDTLLTSQPEGEAAQIINSALAYSATVRQEVQGRANRFKQLMPGFDASPQLTLQRLWATVKEEVLTAATSEKYYLTVGQKTVLRVNQDPEVRRRIIREILKTKEPQPRK